MSVLHEPVRVLVVDDDEDDYALTRDLFRQAAGIRHELAWAPDYGTALAAARAGEHDVWLIDYRLGAADGIALVRELIEAGYDTPIIVLTGQGDQRVEFEAALAGADDYLVKGEITPALLERTVRYAIQRRRHVRALRESEERLRENQRLEALGRLAGGIAHDFNNMMSAVVGFSDLALRRLEEPEVLAQYIGEIKRAGQRAARMTQQLLAFGRRQILDVRPLDLNAVVTDMTALLQRLVHEDIELVTDLEPRLAPVTADPGQLEQAIMNLVINAGDAMPAGGLLRIETANVEIGDGDDVLAPGEYVRLAVGDTGTGMTAEVQARIFEPFFTTKEVGKGTGLGLATVFGIVKQSGGDIRVESEVGVGTTFTILLPRSHSAVAPRSGGQADTVSGGTETILLVEDEELVRIFVREVLVGDGYTVLEAPGAARALELSRDHPGRIDLLLTDVVMSELDGKTLAARIREMRPDIKTIYMSGYSADVIVDRGGLEADVVFLPKPLEHVSLLGKVREVLDGGRPR